VQLALKIDLPGAHKMNNPTIISDPRIMLGKPIIAGTRITVELILEKLGSGETVEQLLESHPRLTREGVLAALKYASQLLHAEAAYTVGSPTA
jgi:uncharacterized protein (DUF433 family)